MPKIYKQSLLSSPLDTPELPEGEEHHPELEEDEDPVRALLSWEAPARPFRKKDRSFFTTATILIVLVSLIVILSGQILLIGALFALLFLIYVLNFNPPEEIKYKISTQGITIGDHFYHWQELDSFWFMDRDGFKLLEVATLIRFPGVLIIVLGSNLTQEEVEKTVAKYLPFHEIPPKSMIDRWSETLQKHFPLENPHR